MRPAAGLRLKIDAGEPLFGVMATDHVWPRLVEICRDSGLDYLIVDCEHGPHSDDDVALASCHDGKDSACSLPY